MLSFLFLMFLFVGGSTFFALLFHKKIGRVVPLWLFAVIFLMFVSGLFGNLLLGLFAVFIMSCAGFFIAVKRLFSNKKRRRTLELFACPGFVALLFAVAVLWVLSAQKSVVLTLDDCVSYAKYVKIMVQTNLLYTQNFQLVQGYADHPPAMPLFEYVFVKFGFGNFERMCWFAHRFFILAFCIPVVARFRAGNAYKFSLFAIISGLAMFFLFQSVSLYGLATDYPLALLSGYFIALVIYGIRSFSVFDTFEMSLCAFCLAIFKSSSVFFLIFAIIGALLCFAITYRVKRKNPSKPSAPFKLYIFYLLCAVASFVTAFLLFKLVLLVHNVPPQNFEGMFQFSAFPRYLLGSLSPQMWLSASHFLQLFKAYLEQNWQFILFCVALYVLALVALRKRIRVISSAIIFPLMLACWFVAIFSFCVPAFAESELPADVLARYFETGITAIISCGLFVVFSVLEDEETSGEPKGFVAMRVFAIAVAAFLCYRNIFAMSLTKSILSENAKSRAWQLSHEVGSQSKIYIASSRASKPSQEEFEIFNYYLYPNADVGVASLAYDSESVIDPALLKLGGFQFVYILSCEKLLKENCSEYFGSADNIFNYSLYEVVFEGNSLLLKHVK
jgi:hypothetical protein